MRNWGKGHIYGVQSAYLYSAIKKAIPSALGEELLYVYESIKHIAAYTIKPHIDSLKKQ